MNHRRSEDRLYSTILIAFLLALVALGLLGVPALLVAAIGIAVAAGGIALFHRPLGRGGTVGRRDSRVPEKYVPSVLEGSSMRRRRLAVLKRHRHASPPLRFR